MASSKNKKDIPSVWVNNSENRLYQDEPANEDTAFIFQELYNKSSTRNKKFLAESLRNGNSINITKFNQLMRIAKNYKEIQQNRKRLQLEHPIISTTNDEPALQSEVKNVLNNEFPSIDEFPSIEQQKESQELKNAKALRETRKRQFLNITRRDKTLRKEGKNRSKRIQNKAIRNRESKNEQKRINAATKKNKSNKNIGNAYHGLFVRNNV